VVYFQPRIKANGHEVTSTIEGSKELQGQDLFISHVAKPKSRFIQLKSPPEIETCHTTTVDKAIDGLSNGYFGIRGTGFEGARLTSVGCPVGIWWRGKELDGS